MSIFLLQNRFSEIMRDFKRMCKRIVLFGAKSDNDIVFCRIYDFFQKDKKSLMSLIRSADFNLSRRSRQRFIYVYSHLPADKASFFEFINGISQNERLSTKEAMDLISYIKIALYIKIHSDMFLKKEPFDLSKVFALLYTLSTIDKDEYLALCSYSEKVLLQDETYVQSDTVSKEAYRAYLFRLSKRYRLFECDAADLLKSTGNVCEKLYNRPSALLKVLCLAIPFIAAAALEWLLYFVTKDILSAFVVIFDVFAFFVFYETGKYISADIISKFVPSYPPMRKSPDYIDKTVSTLCVVTTVLSKNNEKLFEKIENYYLANKNENVVFGVLGDLRMSRSKDENEDTAVISDAKERLYALKAKYGDRFCLFIRPRTFAISERAYMGYERKRGALIDLVKYIKTRQNNFAELSVPKDFASPKYVITLDYDTALSNDDCQKMILTASHPQNKPVIDAEKKRVVKGYGIFEPRCEPMCSFSDTTNYERLYSSVGRDLYPFCSFDLYHDLFDHGIYCGKGIFDVDAYFACVCDTFPSGRILSHDLLEGQRLRSAYLSDTVLYDSAPKDPIEDYKRRHRWVRGDTQSFLYMLSNMKEFSFIDKWQICDNMQRALLPVFSFISLLLSLFFIKPNVILPLLSVLPYLYYPLKYLISGFLRGDLKVKLYSSYRTDFEKTVVFAIADLSFLPYSAYIFANAVIKAMVRYLITRKKTLEWNVFSSSGKEVTLKFSLFKTAFCVIAGIFCVLSENIMAIPFSVMFLSAPVLLYALCAKSQSPDTVAVDAFALRKYAKDMWGFFEDFLSAENAYLIPDNVQYFPQKKVALRTSPTNMGLCLLSILGARDLSYIDSSEMYDKLTKIFETIAALPKYKGHLYNWYDIKNKTVLGNAYVSSVDSGNFCIYLEILKAGLAEYVSEEHRLCDVIKTIDDYLKCVSFSDLYDSKKQALFIGFNASSGVYDGGHYDLYMSEARQVVFYAVARGDIPVAAYKLLRAPVYKPRCGITALSWSGTAFEYFMPTLIMPVFDNTFDSEALKTVAALQYKKGMDVGCAYLCGKSECGYFDFDGDMNYQYRAVGQGLLSCDITSSQNVFSPYSSFLMLKYSENAGEILSEFEKLGAYGKYGFYEAVDADFSRVGKGYAIIESFMAHHVGMSFVACTNAICGDIFVKRFLKIPMFNASKSLLAAKIPVNEKSCKKNFFTLTKLKFEKSGILLENVKKAEAETVYSHIISNGKTKVFCTSLGHIFAQNGNVCFCPESNHIHDKKDGFKIVLCIDGKCISPQINIFDKGFHFFGRNKAYAEYIISYEKIKAVLKVGLDKRTSTVIFDCEVEGEYGYADMALMFTPISTSDKAYKAHPAYEDLFLQCDSGEGCLVFKKRRKEENDLDIYTAVASSNRKIEFESRKESVLPSLYGAGDLLAAAAAECKNTTGACIHPFCLVKSRLQSGKCRMAVSMDNDGFCAKAAAQRCAFFKSDGDDVGDFTTAIEAYSGAVGEIWDLKNDILSHIYFPDLKCGNLTGNVYAKETLWKYGVSGDRPIIFVKCYEDIKDTEHLLTANAEKLLRVFKALLISGIKCDFVFAYADNGEYRNVIKQKLQTLIANLGLGGLLSNGIYICPDIADAETFDAVSNKTFDLQKGLSIGEFCEIEEYSGKMFDKPVLRGGEIGKFTENGYTVSGDFEVPMCHILANRVFGTLLSAHSLGYTWFQNSRENKLTPWSGDTKKDNYGEKLILRLSGDGIFCDYDLCALSEKNIFKTDSAEYFGHIGLVSYRILVHIDPLFRKKSVSVKFDGEIPQNGRLFYTVLPIMGFCETDNRFIHSEICENGVMFKNCFANAKNGVCGALISDGADSIYTCENAFIKNNSAHIGGRNLLCVGRAIADDRTHNFHLCAYRTKEELCRMLKSDKINTFSTGIKLESDDKSLDSLFNTFLPYQVQNARMFARCGFYQVSGAYGFRDYLQDSLAEYYKSKEEAKIAILRAASREYLDGDCQHWWHSTMPFGTGLKSRCSDDSLWLVYAASLYIKKSGDTELLKKKLPYLQSEPLSVGERDRYETATKSDIRESLYMHLVRALEYSFKFGSHGILKIGSHDWNDGLNNIGYNSESVWLGWFCVCVIDAFLPLCDIMGDIGGKEKYTKIRDDIVKNCEQNGYDSGWYLRAYLENGEKLGYSGASECEIDILPQAFAALSGRADEKRCISALDYAEKKLFDKKNKIIKLLSPPFDRHSYKPGYIAGYVPGVRENGGQYTHAALFLAYAEFFEGRNDIGYDMLCALDPSKHDFSIYKNEPYVLSGDVYSEADHVGRGGWSWYTGSAAWYYRCVLEMLLGYRENKNGFTLHPHLCEKFSQYKLTINKKQTEYTVFVKKADKFSLEVDGVNLSSICDPRSLDFEFDGTSHDVYIGYPF